MPLFIFLVSSSTISATAASAAVTTAAVAAAASATVTTATITAAAAAISTTTIAAAATTAISAATVSTAAATTTIAATAAAAISTVTTTAAASGFVRFFHGHLLSADRGIVKRLDRSLSLGLIRHIYKPEAFTSSRFPIHHDLCKIHCAIQFEHFFQVHIIEIIGKTCYKKLHANKFKR